jgi:hypothetical protein
VVEVRKGGGIDLESPLGVAVLALVSDNRGGAFRQRVSNNETSGVSMRYSKGISREEGGWR